MADHRDRRDTEIHDWEIQRYRFVHMGWLCGVAHVQTHGVVGCMRVNEFEV